MVSPADLVAREVGGVALVAVPPRRHGVRPVLAVAARRSLPAVLLLLKGALRQLRADQ